MREYLKPFLIACAAVGIAIWLLFPPLFKSSPSFTEAELRAAEDSLEASLTAAYANSRYDHLEASVRQCSISFRRRNTDICQIPTQVMEQALFYDLTRMVPIFDRARELMIEDKNGNEVMLNVPFAPTGDWKSEREDITDQTFELIDELVRVHGNRMVARFELSRRFVEMYDLEQLGSHGELRYCDGGVIRGVLPRDILLSSPDLQSTLQDLGFLSEACLSK